MASLDKEQKVLPHDLIFACCICQWSLSDIHDAYEPGVEVTIGSSGTRETMLWVTSCAHVICSDHLNTEGASIRPSGSNVEAACPLCSKETGDKALKKLYGIVGIAEGDYDTNIPKLWFSIPPASLDAPGAEMEALRFHYLSLIRYGMAMRSRLKSEEKTSAELKQRQASLLSICAELQNEAGDLKSQNARLRAAEKQLARWKAKEPSIIRHFNTLRSATKENNELKARLSRLAALPGLSERPNVTLNPSERQQLTSENGIRGNQSGGGAASFPKSDESNSKAIKETLIDLSIESDRNSPSDNTRRPEIDNVTNPRHTKPFTPSSLPLPNSPPQPEPHELERGLHAKTTGRTSDTLQSMPPPRFKLRDLLANREPNSIGQSASSLPRPFLPADHELPPTMSFTPAIEDFRYKQEALSKSREGNSARALSDTEGVRRCTPDMRQPSSPFYTPRAPRAPSLLVRHGMSSVVEPRASRRQQDHTRDINHGRSTASPFFPATPVRVDQRSRLRPADMQRPGTGACRNDQHYNGSGQRRLSLATQSPSVSRITGKPLSFSLSATDGQTELLQQRDPRSSYSNRTPSGLFTRSNPILPNLGRERQPPFVRGNSIHNRPANQYPETQKSAQTGAEGPSMSNGPDRPYPTNAIRGFRHLSIAPSVLSRYRNEHSTTTNLNRNPYISTPSRRIFGR